MLVRSTKSAARITYALAPTATTPLGAPMTNTAEIAGSVLGPITRQTVAVQTRTAYLPLVMRNETATDR